MDLGKLLDPGALRDQIEAILERHLKDAGGELRDDWKRAGEEILKDAAETVVAVAQGDPEAGRDLARLKARAQLLGAQILVRENERLKEIAREVLAVAVDVAGAILRRMVLGPL